ncbi:hypothetical protein ASPVEDRAFT_30549 [Aspergillus versicolor CBS 583.65]|uniref:Amino acid permease/ SLC12A domain-containing protein n=1 Tax=Aspergillus versicolor CBS 583.65 TaxID=1036611 RepID=A0A1L9PRE8_ASPVE|nr:uncharacterized protein ASPVEDRAFT_30549 [Aspergillus versicolor CBS 583.65]OJJ04073.1 hypothetical protein ASPVEDRAFT_30549 [Aspergillus versicolor CBS 583.65]
MGSVDMLRAWLTGLWNIIAVPTSLTATGAVIQYLRPGLNVAIWIADFATVVIAINVLHVGIFGEIEFWAGGIKVCIMVILIQTCFIIDVGRDFSHYTKAR